MSLGIRAIHLPAAAALDALSERVCTALRIWLPEWATGGPDLQDSIHVQIRAAQEFERSDLHAVDAYSYEVLQSSAGSMWFRGGTAQQSPLVPVVLGSKLMPDSIHREDDWLVEIIERASDSLNRALYLTLMGEPALNVKRSLSVLPPSLFGVGSGAVQLSCDGLGVCALADCGVWRSQAPNLRARVPATSRRVPVELALRTARAQIQVMLGRVELELPELLDLREGDVLRLPRRLDEELDVLCEGKPMAHALLGEAHGRKCVQLTTRQQQQPNDNT